LVSNGRPVPSMQGQGTSVALAAQVNNFGSFQEDTYQVGWSIDGVAQTAVANGRPLTVGGRDTIALTWANPTSGTHTARAWTILAGDGNAANDTSAPYVFDILPSNILYEETFPDSTVPTGWIVVDNDGGTPPPWNFRQQVNFTGGGTVLPQAGTSFWFDSYTSANANGLIDDWLISPQIPAAGFDSLFFFAGAIGGSFPDSIRVWVSTTGNNVSDFTSMIGYFLVDGPTGSWHKYGFDLSQFSGHNIYLAFNYYIVDGGPSGNNSDNVWFDHPFVTGTSTPPAGWTAQTSGITNQFYSVKAVNQSVSWAAAVGGRVLRTVDGGSTWTSVGGGAIGAADIYNIDAVSANTALVTTTPSTVTYIFRTTNGGTSWDTVFSQSGGFIDAIHMVDATTGYAYGDPVTNVWVVLKTTDGGASWTGLGTAPAQVGTEAGTQNDMCVVGSTIWFGSSAGGRVYRSTDGGASWTSSTVAGAAAGTRVISVWFNDANYGIAGHYTTSGVYNASRSTDGGATWSAITVGAATTYNIAVGGSGTLDFWMARGTNVFTSNDRGASWTQSYTGTGTFYDVDFYTTGSSTYGWGVKDNGNIVMYYGTITGVDEHQQDVPQTFALDQNYPNPFNPSTTLRYALPKDAHISLAIYNILGQKVATLRDEVQNTGYYTILWNGRNDFGTQVASGVYFYRLEARPTDGSQSFADFKKMVFVK